MNYGRITIEHGRHKPFVAFIPAEWTPQMGRPLSGRKVYYHPRTVISVLETLERKVSESPEKLLAIGPEEMDHVRRALTYCRHCKAWDRG